MGTKTDINTQEFKAEIEQLFNSSVSSCERINPFALRIRFNHKTDLSRTFHEKDTDARPSYHADSRLRDLSNQAPVIIFENAFISREDAVTKPSAFLDSIENTLTQDLFHRDVFNTNQHAEVSMLYNPLQIDRNAPTLYALQDSVREVMLKFSKDRPDLLKSVRDSLKQMAENPNYNFSSINNEGKIRRLIETFSDQDITQQLYDQIEDQNRLSVQWRSNIPQVVMHANFSNVLHARPIAADKDNLLRAADLICDKEISPQP